MNLWEELDACKFEDNEALVEQLIQVVKDEGINTLEELKIYEENYFIESGMKKEEWVKWYEDSFNKIPDLERIYGIDTANKIMDLKKKLQESTDMNDKIDKIIKICIYLEKEFCFLVEAYNLIMGGSVTEDVSAVESVEISSFENDNTILNEITIIEKDEVVADPTKNVVLCGSNIFQTEMLRVSERVKALGFNVLLPEEMMNGENMSISSRAHFDRIVNANNGIILVVNAIKNGIPNYMDPINLAEVSLGFYNNKKVFLLNEMYPPFKEELMAWNVVCLNGDLGKIKEGLL